MFEFELHSTVKVYIGNRLCFFYRTQNIYGICFDKRSVNILYSIKNHSLFPTIFPSVTGLQEGLASLLTNQSLESFENLLLLVVKVFGDLPNLPFSEEWV